MREGVAKRIEKLREDSGMSLADMAEVMKMGFAAYRDLEDHDDEITDCITFAKALELARLLKMRLLTLLDGEGVGRPPVSRSFEDLRDVIVAKLNAKEITKESLSWEIDPFLQSPPHAFEEPLMFLQELGRDIGFDWREVVEHYDGAESDKAILQVRPYGQEDESAVIDLWSRCDLVRPSNDPKKDIARKMRVNPELFLVGTKDGVIVACVMAGYEGHRGWINYLAVAPEHQKSGFGRQILDEAERRLRALGCPKINLQVRTDNKDVIAFYERLGFVMDPVVSFGKRLVRDD